MTNEEKYAYWVTHACYDMDTADAMLASGRWVYVVFMCQQVLEKLVKGLYTMYIDDNVPRVHNIKTLFDRFEDKLDVQAQPEVYRLFDVLSSHWTCETTRLVVSQVLQFLTCGYEIAIFNGICSETEVSKQIYYSDSRYPDFMNDPAKNAGKTQAEHIYYKSKEVFQWLQTLKP